MQQTVLEVKDLRTYIFTRRGVVKAVDGVSFKMNQGEAFGIVGESGCGKSMTGLSILRLVPEPAGRIVGGQILFEGEDLAVKSEEEMRHLRGKKISMILQDPLSSLNPALSIGFQVSETLRVHQAVSKKDVRSQAISMLKKLNIPAAEARMDNYPHQMSGGMRQRVVGAIALSCQPSLLIADEPTTCLDVTTQAQYLLLLDSARRNLNASLIFITHDFGIVAQMCDHVAVMYAGRIVEKADVFEIFNNPRHPYTIGLEACVPKLETRSERLFSVIGEPPVPTALPAGCSFAPRCKEAMDVCLRERPPITEVKPGHEVCCWLNK
ncbi:MAG: ABC transporter ATP-binding protein [Dehalococcoidia bacterium]|nr:ABC transporter ATP-binding protein [Dehalococcoidia bacterium]